MSDVMMINLRYILNYINKGKKWQSAPPRFFWRFGEKIDWGNQRSTKTNLKKENESEVYENGVIKGLRERELEIRSICLGAYFWFMFHIVWYREVLWILIQRYNKIATSPAGKHLGLLLHVLLKNKCVCYSYKYKVITHNYVS